MYVVKPSGRFKKDLKVIAKRGYDINLLTSVIKLLAVALLYQKEIKTML